MTELARAAKPWLTPIEAAHYLGFGQRTVERAMELGALPYSRRDGQRLIAADGARIFRAKLMELARDEVMRNG